MSVKYRVIADQRRTTLLFEVAVIQQPTKKEAEDSGALETLVFGPAFFVAKDTQSAGLKALRSDAAKDLDVDKCQVLIRPFV